MPTATLTFDLPSEQDEHLVAINAWRYKSALNAFDQYLRNLSKHGSEAEIATFTPETAKERLWEIAGDLSIDSF